MRDTPQAYLERLEDLSEHLEPISDKYDTNHRVYHANTITASIWLQYIEEIENELITLYKVMPINLKSDEIYIVPAAARFSFIVSRILNAHGYLHKYQLDQASCRITRKRACKSLNLWQEKMGRRLPGIIL